MLKCLSAVFVLSLFSSYASAEWVSGYMKKDGTYVNGYYRTDKNETVKDNYSYKGNVNIYTGESGTNYYKDSISSDYYDSRKYKNKYHHYYGNE